MIPTQAMAAPYRWPTCRGATASATCVDIAATTLGSSLGSVTGWPRLGAEQLHLDQRFHQHLSGLSDRRQRPCLPAGTICPNSTGATDLTLPFVSGTSTLSSSFVFHLRLKSFPRSLDRTAKRTWHRFVFFWPTTRRNCILLIGTVTHSGLPTRQPAAHRASGPAARKRRRNAPERRNCGPGR